LNWSFRSSLNVLLIQSGAIDRAANPGHGIRGEDRAR
jgi:hypothetical protein